MSVSSQEMMRTACSLLALIAGTAGLCVKEADVARICTAGTELGQRLNLALEGCGEGCGRGQACVRRSTSEDINYRTVLGLERQSSHYCSTTDEIESLKKEIHKANFQAFTKCSNEVSLSAGRLPPVPGVREITE